MGMVSGAPTLPDTSAERAISTDNTVNTSVDGSIQPTDTSGFQQEHAPESSEMMDLLDDLSQQGSAPQTGLTPEPQVGPTQEELQETQNEVQQALDRGDIDTAIAKLDEFATAHEGTALAEQAAQFKNELEAVREQQEIEAHRGSEEDPRVQAMREEQERLQEEIDKLKGLNRGSRNQIDEWKERKSEMGLVDRVMGTIGVVEDQIESERDEIARRNEQIRELGDKLDKQERLIQDLKYSEQEGQALQEQASEAQGAGNDELAAELLAQAQEKYNRAQQITEEFEKISGAKATLFSEKYQQEQREALEAYDQVIDRIDTTETVLRTTQKVAIVAGATIATGGTATAVMAAGAGFMTAGAAAVAVGTAAGTAIGGAAAATEAVGHVAHGNKTTEEAFDDAIDQTLEHAQDSAIAAVGTVAGVGAGGKVASAVGGKLTGTAGKVVAGSANGATAGGASAVVSSTAGVAQEYHQALEDFEAQYEGVDMTPEERDQLKAEFMAERGLDLKGITARMGRDAAIGIVAGSVGGGMGAAREGIKKTGQAVAAEAAEAGADVGVGLGAAALEGDLSAENVADAIGGAVIGNVTGRVSHHSQSKRNGTDSSPSGGNTPEGGPSPRPDTDVETDVEASGPSTDLDSGPDSAPSSSNSPETDVDVEAAPESYNIDDYREANSAQGPEANEAVAVETEVDVQAEAYRIEDYQQQEQQGELKMAAGAEGMSNGGKEPQRGRGESNGQSTEAGSERAQNGASQDARLRTDSEQTFDFEAEAQRRQQRDTDPATRADQVDRIEQLVREMQEDGSIARLGGDLSPNVYTPREIAKHVAQRLQNFEDQYGSLGMTADEFLTIATSERMGKTIDSYGGLDAVLDDPNAMYKVVLTARRRFTDSTDGLNTPVRRAWPQTEQEMQMMRDQLDMIEAQYGVRLEQQATPGKFGSVTWKGTTADGAQIEIRFDSPHTIKNGRPIPSDEVIRIHGQGGLHNHFDVEIYAPGAKPGIDDPIERVKVWADENGAIQGQRQGEGSYTQQNQVLREGRDGSLSWVNVS